MTYKLHKDYMTGWQNLYLYKHMDSGDTQCFSMLMDTAPPGHLLKPLFQERLDDNGIEELLKAIVDFVYEEGIYPTKMHIDVKSKDKHLTDMRDITFHLLKMNKESEK